MFEAHDNKSLMHNKWVRVNRLPEDLLLRKGVLLTATVQHSLTYKQTYGTTVKPLILSMTSQVSFGKLNLR